MQIGLLPVLLPVRNCWYFSAGRHATTRREVDPYRLRYVDGGLYLIAYCHLRKDVQMFAVERIKSLTPTDHPYQMPLHFDIDAYVEDALVVMRGKRITIELKFDKATAAWAKDHIWHPSQQTTKLKNGQLLMTLQVADTRELLGWILSFGSGVQVLKPEHLQHAVRKEAKKLLAGSQEGKRQFASEVLQPGNKRAIVGNVDHQPNLDEWEQGFKRRKAR
ncbi:MAG TPA: WYL domain-containing protein [Nitrospira sp.]|nr:WYL domain-containing protein [Nitrospira sp.]